MDSEEIISVQRILAPHGLMKNIVPLVEQLFRFGSASEKSLGKHSSVAVLSLGWSSSIISAQKSLDDVLYHVRHRDEGWHDQEECVPCGSAVIGTSTGSTVVSSVCNGGMSSWSTCSCCEVGSAS